MTTNTPPVVGQIGTMQDMDANASMRISDHFSVTDDHNTFTNVWVKLTSGSGYLYWKGAKHYVDDAIDVGTPAELANVTFYAGSAGSSASIKVNASDGNSRALNDGLIQAVSVKATNTPPVVGQIGTMQDMDANASMRISDHFSVTDDHNTFTNVWVKLTSGSGYLYWKGAKHYVDDAIDVGTPAELANVTFYAGSAGSSASIKVNASDGNSRALNDGLIQAVSVKAAPVPNDPPVVSQIGIMQPIDPGMSLNIADHFGVTDDNNHITKILVTLTSVSDGSYLLYGDRHYGLYDPVDLSSSSQLPSVTFVAGTAGSSAAILVNASDGVNESAVNNGLTQTVQVNAATTPTDPITNPGTGTGIYTFSSAGGTVTVPTVSTIIGGAGTDIVTFPSTGITATVSALELVVGGALIDALTTTTAGSTMLIGSIEAITGGTGSDYITLGDVGVFAIASGIETLAGGGGLDAIFLAGAGNTMQVGLLEYLIGGGGADVVNTASYGSTMAIRGIETLAGGSGTDVITLGDTSEALAVTGLETLTGGTGVDIIHITDAGSTMTLNGVEVIFGGAGTDVLRFADGGQIAIMLGIDTLTGGNGFDFIGLGTGGNTMTVGGSIEVILGGAGNDQVTLAAGGQSILLRGLETLIGSADRDMITLGDTGNAINVSAIDTLIGGASVDTVTVSSGPIRFQGNFGGDTLALPTSSSADTVVYASPDDGAYSGNNTGYDTISNFQTGQDRIVLTSALRSLVDRNGDGLLGSTEAVQVTPTVSSLTEYGLTSVRSAIGAMASGSAGSNTLVLAADTTNTGLYLVTESSGDGAVSIGEIRLLGLFTGTSSISLANIQLG
jgi:hypothetical protein